MKVLLRRKSCSWLQTGWGQRAILGLMLAFCLQPAAQAQASVFFSLEPDYVRPRFSMDTTAHPAGVTSHFFTGRPRHFIGWRIQVRTEPASRPVWGAGASFSSGIWQSRYWLNWEAPGLGQSLDPISTRLIGWYLEAGAHLYRRWGALRLSPGAGLQVGLTRLDLEFLQGTEHAAQPAGGISAGIEAGIDLGRGGELTLGHRRHLVLPARPRYEVEQGVTLRGSFSGGPAEFYLGLSFGSPPARRTP